MSATGQFTHNRDAKEFRRWLDPYAFPEIPEEGEDDWPRGKGQTFDKYLDGKPPQPAARAGRNKIYLQPLGDAHDMELFPSLATLAL